LLQHFHFLDKSFGIDNNAVTDETLHTGMENSGRDEVKNAFPSLDYNSVARVIAPLITSYPVSVVCKKIDDLSLPFVSPLASNNHNKWHVLIVLFDK